MPGFDNTILYADNVDFRGVSPVVGQITQDGQLLIGSSSAPHIQAGFLSSGTGTLSFTPGSGTLSVDVGTTVPTLFKTSSGNATPSGNQLTFVNGSGITMAGSGSTITITNSQTPISTPISPSNGGTGVSNNNSSTLTISGNFATTLTITNTTGVTLPTSGTLATTAQLPSITATQFDVLVGGAANAVTSVGPGSAGQVLQSGGNAANPSYSTPTYPSASGTAGKVLVSDGTNNVYSTPTFPNASATSGKIIKSDGTNWTASTETYAAPGTSGNLMTSDGTNWTSAAPVGSGGQPNLTYISSTTASGSATLNFTSLSASTYRGYRFYLVSLVPATSGAFPSLKLSTDNNSTFLSSYCTMLTSLAGTVLATTGSAAAGSLYNFIGSGSSTVAVSGIIDMYYQGNSNNLVTLQGYTIQASATPTVISHTGFATTQSNVNAIRFLESSGNISTGTIYMFGIT